MYVCLCSPVTERDIEAAVVQAGCQSVRELQRSLGCCRQCGKCTPHARAVMARAAAAGEGGAAVRCPHPEAARAAARVAQTRSAGLPAPSAGRDAPACAA